MEPLKAGSVAVNAGVTIKSTSAIVLKIFPDISYFCFDFSLCGG